MKIFVSYSRSVKTEVGKIIGLLDAIGHDVWWDNDIPIMADWWATILDKIEWCEVFIFVVSKKSVQPDYCLDELKYATERNRPILPFVMDDHTKYTIPPEVTPMRAQWYVYNGDPADMINRLKKGMAGIKWGEHRDIYAKRPPEPNTKSINKQFQTAQKLAYDGNFEEAKQVFRNVKRLDYGEWGVECDEQIVCINHYVEIYELASDKSTLNRAIQKWANYTERFGTLFDPFHLADKLLVSPNSINPNVIEPITSLDFITTYEDKSEIVTSTEPATINDEEKSKSTISSERVISDGEEKGEISALSQSVTSNAEGKSNTIVTSPSLINNAINEEKIEVALSSEPTTLLEEGKIETVVSSEDESLSPESIEILTVVISLFIVAGLILWALQTLSGGNGLFTVANNPFPNTLPTGTARPVNSVSKNDDWIPEERNSDNITMVFVPTGCFMMGNEPSYQDQIPVHEQCFDVPFWIDKYEVTQAQFAQFNGQKANLNSFIGANRPVERITWFEALDYCGLRGGRLPSEREWEYIARGPSNLIYTWGNELGFIDNVVVYSGNSNDQTMSVGSRPNGASWVGAMDMNGNVWEWTSSLYIDYPYDVTHESDVDILNSRVMRGGSWGDDNNILSSVYRFGNHPSISDHRVGFRCVRDY